MKIFQIILLILIILGVGLLLTQKLWVPELVDMILKSEQVTTVTTRMPTETKNWPSVTLENITVFYPLSLQMNESPEYHSVQFFVPGGKEGVPRPQITIETYDNPGNLSLAQFFNGHKGFDLSGEITSGAYSVITVNGRPAYRFVLTEVPAVVVVMSVPNKFIVVGDAGMAFQATGEFEKVLNGLIIGK